MGTWETPTVGLGEGMEKGMYSEMRSRRLRCLMLRVKVLRRCRMAVDMIGRGEGGRAAEAADGSLGMDTSWETTS